MLFSYGFENILQLFFLKIEFLLCMHAFFRGHSGSRKNKLSVVRLSLNFFKIIFLDEDGSNCLFFSYFIHCVHLFCDATTSFWAFFLPVAVFPKFFVSLIRGRFLMRFGLIVLVVRLPSFWSFLCAVVISFGGTVF